MAATVVIPSTPITMANAPPKSLRKLFVPPPPDRCTRCNERVYYMEKVGPVNEVVFHKQCFKCCQCAHHLTLKSYFTNQDDMNDKEIYCSKHCPRTSSHGYDARAMGMRLAMQTGLKGGRYNEQIRGTGDAPKLDSDAMMIRHPLSAQYQYQRKYLNKYDRHHFPAYLVSKTKEKLYSYQEDLERRQREEEDRLMAQFQEERLNEAENMKKEWEQEWEVGLKDLTNKFETQKKRDKSLQGTVATERFEQEKEELKKTMTVRMNKKKEALTLRLQRKAQQETSTLVKKHSEQMLELLKSKQEELEQELADEIRKAAPEVDDHTEIIEVAKAALALPTDLPEAHAPRGRKRDLYHDPSVFAELDDDVFKVAETEQSTFTDLVAQLTENCLSDLQKARAIFRWITVKDLNVMEFDESVKQDTPLGLLRGIKYGTETYHTLFMRLCSYAGIPCQEVKGHSKSVGYEPGMKIPEDKFLNTWNVVLIMGDWWPVQCNWGARHLVLNKDLQDKRAAAETKQSKDKIRYQYDEHYFLTDPDEFIQEFWAQEPEWQLLEKPITLDEFEALPFVRSIFFHYQLEFTEPLGAVLSTDSKGGAEVKLNVPEELGDDIVFHYQLFFGDRERRALTEFRGVKLDRFVYHSLSDGCALFSVHVPTTGSYYLEVFANKIDESNKISDDPNAPMAPFRLKCACKFKLDCAELTGKMHPLPNCASGEWGPSKARRHFGLQPITHSSGVISVDSEVEVRFRQPRRLTYAFKLRFNDVDEHQLQRFVSHNIQDNVLTVRVSLPMVGQYGLDIYAKPDDATTVKGVLAHACKYLLNCTRVANPVDILPPAQATLDKRSSVGSPSIGPRPEFEDQGLKAISHRDPVIDKVDKTGSLTIEIGHPESTRLTAKLSRLAGAEPAGKVAEKAKGKKTKLTVTVYGEGSYTLAIFAARKEDPADTVGVHVYTYRIDYKEPEKKKK